MKKALFLVATAVLTLASCGKSDENPTPDNPNNPTPNNPEPPKTTVVKRIKEVKITYLDRKKNPNSDPTYFLNGEPKFIYTLENGVFSYEYDAQGRISKYTSNKGGELVTYEFSYPQEKIVINDGKKDLVYPLDNKGYLKKIDSDSYLTYDEKGQLFKIDDNSFIWKDGNLTAETHTSTSWGGAEETNEMRFSYYPNENKNRFFIFNNEERDEIDIYTTYFDLLNALPVGVPTKNLLESISKSYTYKKEKVSYATLIKFTYAYDKDGYVSRIVENRSGDDDGVSLSSGSTSNEDVEELEALIAKIKAGTIKNMTYKEFTNANGTYKFSITHKEHITKDSKGKPIDVKYEQERVYTFSYKEENGKRKYLDRKELKFTKQDASTIYEISYY
ncbi:sugar-binding protein [Capnocytophaga endodontalis]|uniref:Sugar-binding protein n=1 Tax=Capnocytophaga endodontalis TaxID=2708117 RepID=A0A1Z4BLN2_9FLAO|nr:sugar-binding protein [Capnocytophaga endodontalis]ASF42196.1 sugar-binding protein [Capnocytophaga endodontalis]